MSSTKLSWRERIAIRLLGLATWALPKDHHGIGAIYYATDAVENKRPDCRFWLWEYQKLASNVLWWVENGKTEAAVRAIRGLGRKYREAEKDFRFRRPG